MKKKTNARQVIRKIVREEVAKVIKEVITELKKPTQQVSPPKPKKKAPLQLIVDNMPKRKIRKENTNIDSIIDDLNLLAKKIR